MNWATPLSTFETPSRPLEAGRQIAFETSIVNEVGQSMFATDRCEQGSLSPPLRQLVLKSLGILAVDVNYLHANPQ